MTERSWQRDFYISACRNGILKNQTKPDHFYIVPTSCAILPTMHHILFTEIIMCGILNYLTPLYAHTDSALLTLDLSTNHTHPLYTSINSSWSSQKLYLPCSASLAFSTKPTLSMHINMPYTYQPLLTSQQPLGPHQALFTPK